MWRHQVMAACSLAAVAELVGRLGDDRGDTGGLDRARCAREECAVSASTATWRVRGGPGPSRGIRRPSSRPGSIGESFACPAVTTSTKGRSRPSTKV